LPPEFIQLAYQIVTQGRQELALAPDAYSGFLMSMLRLLAFMPEDAPASVADVSAGPRAPTPAPRQPAQSAQSAAPVPAAPATALASRDAPPVAGATPRDAGRVTPDDWHALVADLNLGGMARELAQHCDLVERTAGLCRLRLAPAHKHLLLKPAQEKLQQALCERLGETLRLVIELAEVARATPAEVAGEARRARQAQAVAAIEGDPFVQAAIDTFAATLVESSIQPIDPQE
jgi:DNA polymerase-3 subunit gamma/tau